MTYMQKIERWFRHELNRYLLDEMDTNTFINAFKEKIREAYLNGALHARWKRKVETSKEQK